MPLLVMLALYGCERSPDRISVEDAHLCTRCDIQLLRVATLGSAEDTIWPGIITSVVQAMDGRFYVGSSDHPGVALIYGSDGRLQRTFGGSGEGPGEYAMLLQMARTAGDTISVIDIMQSRRTLVDTAGRPLRIHRVPFEYKGIASVNGKLLVQADVRSPDKIGMPIHEVDEHGSILSSFGNVGIYRNPAADGVRPLAPSVDGGLWVAVPNRYELEYYGPDLKRTRTATFDVKWFLPNSASAVDPNTEPPEPRITSIWQASDSTVWVIVRVADAKWQRQKVRTERRYTVSQGTAIYDWIVEAIEPESMVRIGSVRFDNPLIKGIGDDLVYARTEGADGRVIVTAFRPTTRTKGGQNGRS